MRDVFPKQWGWGSGGCGLDLLTGIREKAAGA